MASYKYRSTVCLALDWSHPLTPDWEPAPPWSPWKAGVQSFALRSAFKIFKKRFVPTDQYFGRSVNGRGKRRSNRLMYQNYLLHCRPSLYGFLTTFRLESLATRSNITLSPSFHMLLILLVSPFPSSLVRVFSSIVRGYSSELSPEYCCSAILNMKCFQTC
jgi:hypothetical protein